MAYSADIDSLSPSHRYQLSSDASDSVGVADGTTTGGVFTGTPICEDATNSYVTNALTDRISLPSTTTINNSAQSRKVVAGWFLSNSLQAPPTRIYGEGDNLTSFQFNMAMGNNITFEVIEPTNFTLQIFGPIIEPNRVYHLCGIFEGNGFANKATFYVDGVKMINTEPIDSQPNTPDLNLRSVGFFGDSTNTTGIGGGDVLFQAGRDSYYNQWALWSGTTLTDIEVEEVLFEKGVLPDLIISSSATQALMQSQLTAINSTIRDNAPLCIRIEPLTGGGDFTLTSNDLKFNPLSSIHIQYSGSDTLTWENINDSNAVKTSTPVTGGILNIINEYSITLTNLQINTEIRILKSSDRSELAGVENVTTGSFEATILEETVDIVIVSLNYVNLRFNNQVVSKNRVFEINQIFDRYYLNP